MEQISYYVSEMRNKLTAYINESSRNQKQIAHELSISQTRLSQFLKGTYPGDNEALAKSVEQFLIIGSARKALAQAPDISLEVSSTKQILRSVYNAHISKDILLVYGPAGCSKTTTLKHYRQGKTNVIYIEADVTMNTHRYILLAILEELREDMRGSTNILMRRLISKLRDTSYMVIIDEAQHLTEKAFDAIRALNDKSGVALVFAGNPRILKQMYGYRADDFDQVYSRIGCHCELSHNYMESDIAAIFSGYNMSRECLKYLHRISKRKGGLRLMIKQYTLAANIAISIEQDLSVMLLDEAAKRMGIGGQSNA